MIDQTVFQNKTAAYYTLGCKLNFAETSTIGKSLATYGIRKIRPGEKADFCIINTCSVTELADKKCRQAIRRIGKQHPEAVMIVTGCYAQLKPEEVAHIEGVDLVVGSEQKLDILKFIDSLEKRKGDAQIISSETKEIRTFTPSKCRMVVIIIVPIAPFRSLADGVVMGRSNRLWRRPAK